MKQNNNYLKIALGCGVAVLMIGTIWYLRNRRVYNSVDAKLIRDLVKKINYSELQVQQSLVSLSVVQQKEVSDGKITMKFSLVENLGIKGRVNQGAPNNPFAPPYEKGMLITQLSKRHRLIYNKFNILKNHLLIVTSQFQQQTSPLNLEDFYQTALVVSSLQGCFFFNCGKDSGFSQKHKHIQVLPKQSKNFPLIKAIKEQIKSKKLVKMNRTSIAIYNNFEFIHGVVPLPEKKNQYLSLEEQANHYLRAYEEMKRFLGAVLRKQEFSYNLVGCSQFIMMIPRKKQFIFNSVGINACGFMGTVLFKDQKLFEKIELLAKPSQILREITFTQKPR